MPTFPFLTVKEQETLSDVKPYAVLGGWVQGHIAGFMIEKLQEMNVALKDALDQVGQCECECHIRKEKR